MFGIGGMELLIILLVGVVVLGPERLPIVMRKGMKLMSDFRRVSTDLQRTINAELNLDELNRQQLESSKTIAKPPVKKKKKVKKAAPAADDNAEKPKHTPAKNTEEATPDLNVAATQAESSPAPESAPEAEAAPAPEAKADENGGGKA